MKASKAGKRIGEQSVLGQRGVALVSQRVLDMGFLFHPTVGTLDAGIDGFIELRDKESGEVHNLILQVQSKATAGKFSSETTTTFAFICDERDLTYWMQGNAPVILVVSRPDNDEAYWVSVKEYFKDPALLKSRKIVFDKAKAAFGPSAKQSLIALALPQDSGIYFAPTPREESLFSNMLGVTRVPETLWVGQALLKSKSDFVRSAREKSLPFEWVHRGDTVISTHDLSSHEWRQLIDRGTVESLPASEWSMGTDERAKEFVELLNRCLRSLTTDAGLIYNRKEGYFFFPATEDLSPRVVNYSSVKRDTDRVVFQKYATKKADQEAKEYYRHSAFSGQFHRYDGEWFLDIVPKYHFTHDGRVPHRFAGSKRAGIKALERNPTVLGQVVMWADLLRGDREKAGLFAKPEYPFLGFGQLATFTLDVGINDNAWLARAEVSDTTNASVLEDLPLFLEGK